MASLALWVARFGHNAALQRLLVAVAPLAGSRLFPLMGGVLAFIATLSLTIPVVPVLTALVVMNRARWRSITFWAVLGSAFGGALVICHLGHGGHGGHGSRRDDEPGPGGSSPGGGHRH
jgi:hypothetical protein